MPVMLLRNLNLGAGLANGTRLRIKAMKYRVIQAEILTGPKEGEDVFIPRITLDAAKHANAPFPFQRKQFPLQPAFAMTINKGQGQTLEMVGLDLTHEVFGHGQLYVALSRVGDATRLFAYGGDLDNVRNVVYRDAVL
ncbi:unnamed protein product [Vitrella brassicaformis CCMP3155]|uniref:DNA helicase Pif1-like 2B domain-containing protein n=1 Tax=Vitrella brassicaformis (strain CCMP3155) TaxID=1169540 RepID=A0A0G4F362_VITBC|nr:unnamed protein product [Vitrella brassicaformis CCMP3155]|eukprot:CEM06316.1 unnamed protein product [Vitrella brassicaformis CCMP3155]